MILHLVASLLMVAPAWAASSNTATRAQAMNAAPAGIPAGLEGIGIDDKLGADLPLGEVKLRDEEGKTVALGEYFQKGRPVILVFAYFGCPTLCTLVLNGTVEGLRTLDWNPGREFEVVTVSIDPREGPELAAKKKASYLKSLGRPGAEAGWHFLTGDDAQIHKLADAIGFKYKFVKEENQYAHGAAIFVATPAGKLSRILYGVEFKKQDLKLALLEASNGKIGSVVDRFLLFCYRYDPHQRKYSIIFNRLMQAGGAGTILVFGGYLMVFWRRERRGKGV